MLCCPLSLAMKEKEIQLKEESKALEGPNLLRLKTNLETHLRRVSGSPTGTSKNQKSANNKLVRVLQRRIHQNGVLPFNSFKPCQV